MNKTDKILSVVTATYNYMLFLPNCLKSVQDSILSPMDDWKIEHIVVDDGSTDGTEKLLADNSVVRFFRMAKNQGASAARNFGIKQARGKYIFVLDADDVILQRSLYYLISSLLVNPDRRWAYGDMLRVDKNLNYLPGKDYYGWLFADYQEMLAAIVNGQHFIEHNTIFEKKLFEEVGGYNEKMGMGEDLDLYIRFLLKGLLPVFSQTVTHLHRYHGKNISGGFDKSGYRFVLGALIEKYRSNLFEQNILNKDNFFYAGK